MKNGPRSKIRPSVLAHVRFLRDRTSFQGLGLRERFERIYETNLWGAETSLSGLGSEADATEALRRELPVLLRRLRVSSLLDAPCGDASWILRTDLGIAYTGVDIVAALIDGLRRRSENGELSGEFIRADITKDPLPRRDAVLCRDCLVHLSYKNIAIAIDNFRRSQARYLITTTFHDWTENADIEDGDWRALNFEAAPFGWPPPIERIEEQCLEGDGAYRDKSLGVWRLDSLP